MARNNLKKIDLVKKLSDKMGLSQNLSKKIIDDLIKIIIENIKLDNFNLKNIGSFKILSKNQRIGRNPMTKKKIIISARKSIKFIASKRII